MNAQKSITPLKPLGCGQAASGSTFYEAMLSLPPRKREAIFTIYDFCHRLDDIADSDGSRTKRLRQLAECRRDIDAIYKCKIGPKLCALCPLVREYGLAHEDFVAFLDGMEMDTVREIRAPTSKTLDLFCDRVASAVGRLSVQVFGMKRKAGKMLAHHLGRALQLTNILRDLDEDAGRGRLYLPRKLLRRAGIKTTDPATVLRHPALPQVLNQLVQLARGHFDKVDGIMKRSPRRVVQTPHMMAIKYRALLEDLVRRSFPPRRKNERGR